MEEIIKNIKKKNKRVISSNIILLIFYLENCVLDMFAPKDHLSKSPVVLARASTFWKSLKAMSFSAYFIMSLISLQLLEELSFTNIKSC